MRAGGPPDSVAKMIFFSWKNGIFLVISVNYMFLLIDAIFFEIILKMAAVDANRSCEVEFFPWHGCRSCSANDFLAIFALIVLIIDNSFQFINIDS